MAGGSTCFFFWKVWIYQFWRSLHEFPDFFSFIAVVFLTLNKYFDYSESKESPDIFSTLLGTLSLDPLILIRKLKTSYFEVARSYKPLLKPSAEINASLPVGNLPAKISEGLNYELSSLETWLASVASTVLSATMGVHLGLRPGGISQNTKGHPQFGGDLFLWEFPSILSPKISS